jgi:hypothetical protein
MGWGHGGNRVWQAKNRNLLHLFPELSHLLASTHPSSGLQDPGCSPASWVALSRLIHYNGGAVERYKARNSD